MAIRSTLLLLLATATVAQAQPGVTDPADSTPRPRAKKPRSDGVSTDRVLAIGLRLTGLSGVGALPGVNIGGEVAGYVRWEQRFVELGLGHWQPEKTMIVREAPERIELGLDVWTLRAGWASMERPLRAWLLVEAGELAGPHGMMPTGVPRMVTGQVASDHTWLAAGGGFGVAWPMSDRARLVGNVELAVPFGREPMMMDTGQSVQPDAAAARASLGIEVGWR